MSTNRLNPRKQIMETNATPIENDYELDALLEKLDVAITDEVEAQAPVKHETLDELQASLAALNVQIEALMIEQDAKAKAQRSIFKKLQKCTLDQKNSKKYFDLQSAYMASFAPVAPVAPE